MYLHVCIYIYIYISMHIIIYKARLPTEVPADSAQESFGATS